MYIIERQVRTKASEPIQFIAKNLGIGFFAAIVTGIISGLLLRLIMKIIAMVFPHMAGGFTFEGTFLLILLGIGFSLANSIVYTFVHRYLPSGWVRKGFIYGGMNLVILGISFFLSNPDNDLFGPQAPLGITLFSLLFLFGGLLLARLVDRVTNWVERSNSRLKYTYIFFALLIVPAVVMSGGIIYEIVTEIIPAIRSNF
ncbi:tetrahydromethanopterin S-methyltransferase subunit G [Neobacillus sp. B4I6]|uniref:hypothetical protein n=1 Tax=Neobacillus sp. B4I6 TaxID=3373925 RepID=UPI003D1CDF0B